PAPRRGPLTQTGRPIQAKTQVTDVVGRGGGKENVPPGHTAAGQKKRNNTTVTITFDDEFLSRSARLRGQNAILPTELQESRKRTNSESNGHREKRYKATNVVHTTVGTTSASRPSGILKHTDPKESNLLTKPQPISSSLSTCTFLSAAPHDHTQARPPPRPSIPLVVQLAQGEQSQYP